VVRRTTGLGGRATALIAVVLAALFVSIAAQPGAADDGPALLSIADVSATEGSGGSPGNATLTITLSHAAASDVTVHWATSDGTAKQSVDYNQSQGDTTIGAGATSADISIPLIGNNKPEDDKTFNVTLSNPTVPDGTDPGSVGLDHATAVVTIVDDDWRFAITSDPSPATAAENGGKIDFVVALKGANGNDATAPPNHKLSVDYKVNNDSAVLGTNFKLTDGIDPSGTFTFAPGDTVKHIRITGLDDHSYGPTKSFNVTLSNPKGGKLVDGADQPQGATITNTNPAPLIGISDCAATVNAGGDATFVVRTSGATQLPATVHYTTVDDSTTANDYDHLDGDLSIPAGQSAANIVVHTKANPPDGDRSFHVQLSNPQNVTFLSPSASSANCTIHQGGTGGGGSKLGSVSISGPDAVMEPAAGSSPVDDTFTVTYTPPSPQPSTPQTVTVNWTTKDGTAKAPADYVAASGTLTWAAGAIGPKTFAVKVNPAGATPDTTAEVFSVTITATNATVAGTGSAGATILPRNTTTSTLSVADASDVEGAGTIPVKVTLSPAATAPVTVHYATEDGTATAGRDYTATSGDLTFAPGELSKSVPIPIINNSTPERDKTLTLRLSGATGAAIGRAAATVTIVNDDALPAPVPRANPFTTPLQAPVPLPQPQPRTPGGANTHLVLPAIVNGESKVDARGRASFKITCPKIVVKQCKGSIVLEVRVAQKTKKGSKAKLKTIRVGNGTFTIAVGKTKAVPVKLTKAGFDVVKSLHRIRVKATIKAVDGSGTKGVTAWLVSLVEPKRSTQISVKVK
jgi:Calx-beta domain-containing protein